MITHQLINLQEGAVEQATKNLQIRMSPWQMDFLRVKAAKNGRSMNMEVMDTLQKALFSEARTVPIEDRPLSVSWEIASRSAQSTWGNIVEAASLPPETTVDGAKARLKQVQATQLRVSAELQVVLAAKAEEHVLSGSMERSKFEPIDAKHKNLLEQLSELYLEMHRLQLFLFYPRAAEAAG